MPRSPRSDPAIALKALLEKNVRLHRPDLSVVPARFATYTPLDLYQRFLTTGFDYKGQISTGFAEVGWSLEVGPHDFDFSPFISSFKIGNLPTAIGSLTPKLVYERGKPAAALIVIQRLPSSIVFYTGATRLDAATPEAGVSAQEDRASVNNAGNPVNGSARNNTTNQNALESTTWTVNPRLKISLLTLGGIYAKDPEDSKKTISSLAIGLDFQIGGNPPKPVIAGTSNVKAPDPYKGDNSLTLGLNLSANFVKSWSQMKLYDSHPGYYPSAMDNGLQDDFATLVGDLESKKLYLEIYKWLRTVASTSSKDLTDEDKDVAAAIAGWGGTRVSVALIDSLLAPSKKLSVLPNVQRGLRGLKNVLQKKDMKTLKSALSKMARSYTEKRINLETLLEKEMRDTITQLVQEMTPPKVRLSNQRLRPNEIKCLQALLDSSRLLHLLIENNDLTSMTTQTFVANTSPVGRISKMRNYVRGKRKLNTKEFAQTVPIQLNQKELLRTIVSGIKNTTGSNVDLIGSPAAWRERYPYAIRAIECMQSTLNDSDKVRAVTAEVRLYRTMATRSDDYAARLGNLSDHASRKTILNKSGSLSDMSTQRRAFLKRLTYVDMMTTKTSLKTSAAGQAVMGFFGQAMVVGSLGVGGSIEWATILKKVTKSWANHSNYRYQFVALSTQDKPLVITQDTKLTYSQTVLEGDVGANFIAFSGTAEKSAATAIFNAVNYTSTLLYWRYPEQKTAYTTLALLGKGSGFSIGCSVPVGYLIKLAKEPESHDSLARRNTLATLLMVPEKLIDYLLRAANFKEMEPEDLPIALLLEANYAFSDTFIKANPVKLTQHIAKNGEQHYEVTNGFADTNINEYMFNVQKQVKKVSNLSTLTSDLMPDTLRIRFRMADVLDNSETKFKTGILFNIPYLSELHPIERAGQEGVSDFYTLFVKKSQYNEVQPNRPSTESTATENSSLPQVSLQEGHEESVPPVVLLEQAFGSTQGA